MLVFEVNLMRKHLAAAFLVGSALHGGTYLLLQKTGSPSWQAWSHSGVLFDLLGSASQLTSNLVSPRNAVAGTVSTPSPQPTPVFEPVSEDTATATVESDSPPEKDACPTGMVLVEGEYCPNVIHTCKKWMETTGRYKHFRCAEYSGAKCLSKQREHRRFCMDRDEFTPPGEKLPVSHASWTDATRTCGSLGKRVCLESEWNFACEGEEMRPYPYGWKRDPEACNADRLDLYRADGSLRDLRVGAEDNPRCVSPFGVHNMSGNLEEWTTIDASAKIYAPRPAMKGAYWQPSRNHCRAAQTAHDRFYNGTETGFRCCADAN